MKKSCKRCIDREFEVPDFTTAEKIQLSKLKASNRIEQLVQKIESSYGLESIDTKFSLMHINKKYGKCNRCNFEGLEGEYLECPKCSSLNFNWKWEK